MLASMMSAVRVVIWTLCSVLCQVPTACCFQTTVKDILTAAPQNNQTETLDVQKAVDMLSPATPVFTQTPWKEDDILSETEHLTRMYLNWSDCQERRKVELAGESGDIRAFIVRKDADRMAVMWPGMCFWQVTVPAGMYAVAEVLLPATCAHEIYGTVRYLDNSNRFCEFRCTIGRVLCFSTSNKMVFELSEPRLGHETYRTFPKEFPSLRILFQATTAYLALTPRVVFSKPTAGSLTPHGYDGVRYIAGVVKGIYPLRLPAGHVVMVSFPHLANTRLQCMFANLNILAVASNNSTHVVHRECFDRPLPAEVYNTSITVHYTVTDTTPGFRMLFSFHPFSEAPRRLESGLYDCSVPHYTHFKQHVQCNLDAECAGGQDEGQHCAFSPPGCKGRPGHGHKCYSLLHWPKAVTWQEARRQCRQLGGDLAMMKTEGEWRAFRDLFRYGKRRGQTFVGLTHCNDSMPAMYRYSKMWVDGTILYNRHTYVNFPAKSFPAYYVHTPQPWIWFTGEVEVVNHFACQFGTELSGNSGVKMPVVNTTIQRITNANGSLFLCQSGHITKDFLSCDPLSYCVAEYQSQCRLSHFLLQQAGGEMAEVNTSLDGLQNAVSEPSLSPSVAVEMFTCTSQKVTLPYTLVCDFTADCADRSDESFCHHELCDGFTCRNGQCIPTDKRCNTVSDCLDGSDEEVCRFEAAGLATALEVRLAAPAIVTFQGDGYYTQEPMSESKTCPETHLRCPGESDYCLPVYVRCNGVYDCVGHEDEVDCQNYTCPGFYRCRASSVCVHLGHLCDGWPQCPQRDDELLCDFTCPPGCGCQGLAFVCPRPFPASQYPELRYLDATGSELTIENLESNRYLIWLCLAFCRIGKLSVIPFMNLKTLDLSHNRMSALNLSLILTAENLEVLSLANNPLTSITDQPIHSKSSRLRRIDLSHTHITVFEGSKFTAFPHIQFLNISYSGINTITEDSFQHLPRLAELDMTGLSVRQVSAHLFSGLQYLRQVHAGDYRLCCPHVLPDNFGDKFCFAPGDLVSSCQYLLGSDMHRVLVWAVGLMALVGNAASIAHQVQQAHSTDQHADSEGNTCCFLACFMPRLSTGPGTRMLIINLQLANFAMGVYCAVLAVADRALSGFFVMYQETWTTSLACRTAGFLWLVSSQASALLLCLITLNSLHAVGIQLPGHTAWLSSWCATHLSSLAAWILAILLAAVPLVPGAWDWQLYGQNALCIPSSLSRSEWPGRGFVFGAIAVVNFVLSVVIGIGQLLVYCTVRAVDSDLHTNCLLSQTKDAYLTTPTATSTAGSKTTTPTSGRHRGTESVNLLSPRAPATQLCGGRSRAKGVKQPQPQVHSPMGPHSESHNPAVHVQAAPSVTEVQTPSAEAAVHQVSTSRCLVSVAMADALCMFSVGLLGLLAWLGLDGAAGLFERCVVYAVPVNSALNPLLYMYNVRGEKQREAEKAKLLAVLKARITSTANTSRSVQQLTAPHF